MITRYIQTEKRAIEKIKGIFNKNNVLRFTPGQYSPRGVPDLYILNLDLWVEIKIDGAPITESQKFFFNNCIDSVILHINNKENLVYIVCRVESMKVLTFYDKIKFPGFGKYGFEVVKKL